jgi:hypothetical protein
LGLTFVNTSALDAIRAIGQVIAAGN